MRLNIGCGPVQPEDWVNADSDGRAPVHADLRVELPWDTGTFDYAVANHVLQMLRYEELVPALGELRRVIRPGGILRLLVPDLPGALDAWLGGDARWFPQIVGDEVSLDGRFCSYLTWYGTARTVFTGPWLMELCLRAGFRSADPARVGISTVGVEGICELDSRPDESLVVEAQR